jgi:Sec-independent protein secretion pathway component TatC
MPVDQLPDHTPTDAEQPLIAHLLELRTRLLWCVGIVLVVFVGL